MTNPADAPSLAAGTPPAVDRRRLLAIGVVLALAGATVAVALRHVPAPVPGAGSSVPAHLPVGPPPVVPADVATITVHVAGAVMHPGLISVADDARVADAIAAAGGATGGADLGAINLAAPITDGTQLVVPAVGGVSVAGAATAADGPIDLNQAGVEDLVRLDGVGEVLARRIVAHRDAHGPFGTIEDLLDVAGIGEGKLAAIREGAIVR